MSPRAIAAVLIAGVIAVGVVLFLQTPPQPTSPAPTPAALEPQAAPPAATNTAVSSGFSNLPSPVTTHAELIKPPENLTPVAKVEKLQALAMEADTASLNFILGALTDPDPEVRAAAREAAIQFGDPKAAGPLRDAAAKVDNLEEKVALLDAAKYLELPAFGSAATTNQSRSDSANPPRP